ncbi:glycoside hydrolase family protein [Lactobacillaceae bacterium Scapto_B20]
MGSSNAGGDQIATFTSPTGMPNTWTNIGNSASFSPAMNDNAPSMIECPVVIPKVYDYATNQEKAVMFFSGDGGNDGKGVYYQVGHLEDNGLFVADSKTVRRIDNGADDYAANYAAMDDEGKQLMMIGWIGNWNRDYNDFMKANSNYHIGSFTLPRILRLNNGILNSQIVEPTSHRYFNKKNSHGLTLKGTNTSSKIVVTFKKPVKQNIFAMVQSDTTTNVNVFSNGKNNQQNNVTISQPFSQLGGAEIFKHVGSTG